MEQTSPNQITLTLRGKETILPANISVHQALKRLGLSPEGYLVVRNGEVITEDQLLRPGERVRIVPVISGGSGRL